MGIPIPRVGGHESPRFTLKLETSSGGWFFLLFRKTIKHGISIFENHPDGLDFGETTAVGFEISCTASF